MSIATVIVLGLHRQDGEDLEKIEQATASVTTTDILIVLGALVLAPDARLARLLSTKITTEGTR